MINTKHVEREASNQARELTSDELERVAGGTPAKKDSPVPFFRVELKEAFISGVSIT